MIKEISFNNYFKSTI